MKRSTVFEHFEEGEGGDIDLLGRIQSGRIGGRVAQSSSGTGEHPLKPLHTGHTTLAPDRGSLFGFFGNKTAFMVSCFSVLSQFFFF